LKPTLQRLYLSIIAHSVSNRTKEPHYRIKKPPIYTSVHSRTCFAVRSPISYAPCSHFNITSSVYRLIPSDQQKKGPIELKSNLFATLYCYCACLGPCTSQRNCKRKGKGAKLKKRGHPIGDPALPARRGDMSIGLTLHTVSDLFITSWACPADRGDECPMSAGRCDHPSDILPPSYM
jgi:hypothetical protein